ncbi:MAG: TetR/AcrR family transcriptional regulator [Reichenbachiella sp.]|uniref:TetR/AcrR family transcriptional regulator n=1 Tax=Reichenbachiella sp. TaxID=2184521 RepID=UPI0029671228|nr:TetR/AcrR family transcriptional regulator [Reichenbachiella sp.]MDW3209373.1 TetR/AcrR family transcriptional regulator [Reichenbachiella sp.]
MINNTKEKILENTEALFNKYGVRSVSMDDIARELSISKKTIYQFFKDKDELVTLITKGHIDRERSEMATVKSTAENAIDELFKLSHCIREHVKEINPSMLFDIQKYHPSAWALWLEYKNVFIKNTILDVIARGKSEGYFRPELDAEIISTFRVESIELSFDEKIFPRDKFDFTEVQMTLFDHFVHGLMTVKGLELYDSLIDAKSYESN